MNKTLPTRKFITFLLAVIFYIHTAFAGIEPIPTGSFIINMGVVPQTYGNGLKPWGMIWNLIHNYKVPVKWVINQSKVKDGKDFTYNGNDFSGGTFIILKKSRNTAVDSVISAWQLQGVVGITTTSDFTADVTYTIKYNPLWTFDFQNGKIAINYLTIAGIPTTGYPMKDPAGLNDCDDLFVMPHADPTWGTHQNLLWWNANNRGWLWYGCHAGSVIESTLNPVDSTQQMDFLTTTGLVNFSQHSNPTTPYNYRFPIDPEMQFIGTVDAAETNGSEQVYLPKLGGGWRSSTNIAVWDPTDPDVPLKSPGNAAIIAYGRAFGDSTKGKVMLQAGHSFDKGNAAAVAAIRVFFNFSYLSVLDKIVTPDIVGSITCISGSASNYTATLPAGYSASNYSFHWTSNGTGKFSNEYGASTSYTPSAVGTPTDYTLTVTITDGCGREYYQTLDITVSGVPPVALDRTTKMILNAPGTGPQPIGNSMPLAGTDADGFVTNYILKSLPSNGSLLYDNDNNPATPDVVISSIPAGGFTLTSLQMKSLKYDPVDGFGGSVNFQYMVKDNTNLLSLNTVTYTIPVNPPPVAQNFVCAPVTSNADVTPVCPLVATDNNSIASYTIVSVPPPSKCSVYLNKVLVTPGQVISPAQASLLTYKPSGTYVGYAEITYTATDNDGTDCEKIATLTLQMVNQPPVPQDVAAPTITNPVGSIQFSIPALKATDVDGSIVSYKITNIPPTTTGILYYNTSGTTYATVNDNQVLTVAQATSLKFDPVDTYSGVAQFKYTATDNGGLTGNIPGIFSIPVKTIVPTTNSVTNPSIYVGSGLTALTVTMSGATADASKTITDYVIISIPSTSKGVVYYHVTGSTFAPIYEGQKLLFNQVNQLKFQPSPGYTGNFVFRYVAEDNTGLSDPTPATFTIPVTNQAPIATNITNAVIFDTSSIKTIKPLAGTDADGRVSTFIILTLPDPSTGVLSLNGLPVSTGQIIDTLNAVKLKFQPVLHNSNDAIFKFTVVDNFGLADASAATFTIPITLVPYQSAPTANALTSSTLNLKNIFNNLPTLIGNDADGYITSFKITKLNNAGEGTLYLQGIPVTLNQVIDISAADQLTFLPSGTFQGTSICNYVSIDNDGLSSAQVSLKIPISNAFPVVPNFTANQVKTSTTNPIPKLQATDEDGSIASFKILTLPSSGTLQYDSTGTGIYGTAKINLVLTIAKASKLRYVAGATIGSYSFTFTAKDNMGGNSIIATYTIPVGAAALNQAPIPDDVTSAAIAYNAGLTSISPLSGTDAEGPITGFVIESIPPSYYGSLYYDSSGYYAIYHGIIKISPLAAATLKFAPSGTYIGNVTFTYKVVDSTNSYSSTEAIYTIPVVNAGPVVPNITNPAIPSINGPTIINPLKATTAGTITQYIITGMPGVNEGTLVMDGNKMHINQVIPAIYANRLEFSPKNNFSGSSTFTFTAVDNFGATNQTPATFTIPVTNQAPLAENKVSQVITNPIGTPAQSIPAVTGIDEDGTIASFIIKSLPGGGKLYKNGTLISSLPVGGLTITTTEAGQLSFDPDDNFGGVATFTYSVKDNTNNVSAAAATYQIFVNGPPMTNNIVNAPLTPGQPRTNINGLTGSDDGAIVFYSILSLPSPSTQGSLYLNNVQVTDLSQVDSITPAQAAQLSFQPLASFDGTLFTYTATDNTGLIDVTPAVYNIPSSSFGILNPLPLQLLSFSGYKSTTDNILNWSMSQEINSNRYEVENSLDGTNYTKIATVTAAGNTSTKTSYTYNDKNAANGVHYYRIKLVSNDGQYQYSKIIVIKRDGSTDVYTRVMGNPFKDRIVIELMVKNEGRATFTLFDMKGNKIKRLDVTTVKGINLIQLNDLSKLSSGMFILHISSRDGETNAKLYKTN